MEGDEVPEFWKQAMRTPDTMKEELSGERFVAGTHRGSQRWYGRRRKTRIDVDEPLMKLLDAVMEREGVSDDRMESALHLYDKKLKDMRTKDGQWRIVRLVRQMLWAMGYDLEVRVVKKKNPDRLLVMTNSEVELKKRKGITEWDRLGMWKFLGMEKLSERD